MLARFTTTSAVLLGGLFLACSPKKREQPSPPRVTSSVSKGASASARLPSPRDANPAAFCERIRAEQRRQKPDLRRLEPDSGSTEPVLSEELERGGCFSGAWGAWAIELRNLAE